MIAGIRGRSELARLEIYERVGKDRKWLASGGHERLLRSCDFAPDVPEYGQLTKATRCDAQGSFVFERVADGTFVGRRLMQRVSA